MDDMVADKLGTLAPAPTMGSWQAFEQKLRAAEVGTSSSVDTAVTEGLERSAPARVSGWAQLAARLDTIGKRREMVGCMKVTETAFLLSMLVLFVQFTELDIASSAHIASVTTEATPLEKGDFDTRSVAAHPAVSSTATSGTEVSLRSPLTTQADSPRNTQPAQTIPTSPPSRITDSSDAAVTSGPANDIESTVDMPTLAQLRYGVERDTPDLHPELQLGLLDDTRPIRYYVNVFASPMDLNQVKTRRNENFGIPERTLLSKDWSVGALLDISQGKNSIQTGIIYANRSYVPAEVLVLENQFRRRNENNRIRFGRLRYNTVSIPLNYQRVVRRTNDWQFSAGLGVAANVILASEFKLANNVTREELEHQIEVFRAESAQTATGKNQSLFLKGKSNFVDPSQGYLQGGSLIDNTSLYISGNIRVERLLDDRWSLYFSPTVSRLFTLREEDGGKGPLQDRIHNTMLRLGTRYRLTNK